MLFTDRGHILIDRGHFLMYIKIKSARKPEQQGANDLSG
jgi:hypothetical protein